MNAIIMGCGRVGAHLAQLLCEDGHDVVVLDVDPYSFRRLPEDFKGRSLVGDGTDENSLVKAGIEQADAFVAVTQGDNRNVMAAQIAKHIFEVPRVACRIYDPLREQLYSKLGLATISPTVMGAERLRAIVEG